MLGSRGRLRRACPTSSGPRQKPLASALRAVAVALVVLALFATPSFAATPLRASPPTAPAQGAASTSAVLPPWQDPFYRYTGTTPLQDIPPGTILKQRSVEVALGTTRTPVRAEQLLYRTTGELGEPTVTVTTVLLPAKASVPRLVEYLSFYDALGAQCDPSYTLQGGNPGAANEQQTEEEEAVISSYLAAGFVLTVPDFEGETLDWTAGQEAGYGALDAIRATEAYLGLAPSSPVGLTGYSGGSIAADWASELQPGYAPALHLVGVAEGGLPVDYAHNLAYINGSQGWSGVIPAALVGLTRAFRVDLTPYLSSYGETLVAEVQHACIGSFYGAFPGLRYEELLKPQYDDIDRIPIFVEIIDHLIMGSAPTHPTGPLFLAVGDADGTGDGIMVTADVEALAHKYCEEGVPLELAVYQGDDHDQAAVQFEPAAIEFLEERFAGVPFENGCASVPHGDSIAPLAMPSPAATAPPQLPRPVSSERGGTTALLMGAQTAERKTLPATGLGAFPLLLAAAALAAGLALVLAGRLGEVGDRGPKASRSRPFRNR